MNLTVFGTLISLIIITITTYILYSFTYWKRRKIPYLVPHNILGHLPNALARDSESFAPILRRFYNEIKYGRKLKYAGIYFITRPLLLITDLEHLKLILTKDFQYFIDRGMYYNEKDDPLSAHLFAIGGQKWRQLRTKFTPTFTSGKMRQMFQTLVDCKSDLLEKIATNVDNHEPIDIKDATSRYTIDVIGSCAFGFQCRSFKDPNSPFREYSKRVVQLSKWRVLLVGLFAMNFPDLARSLRICFFDKDVVDFYTSILKDTVDYRETNRVQRKDFLQLLIDMKNNAAESLTMDELTAQSLLFFLAGFETSSAAMTFALYELAQNQQIQQRLRDEIVTILDKHNNQITYDAMNDLKYMNQVINETLRKYPPLPAITRVCIKDYQIPGTDTTIEKGTTILIPIYGIHMDGEFYADPDRFDPERFSDVEQEHRHQYAHMPFGEGPRICIGMRFGLMQTKVGLTALLRDFKFTLNDKTPKTMTFAKDTLTLTAEHDIWLDAEKI